MRKSSHLCSLFVIVMLANLLVIRLALIICRSLLVQNTRRGVTNAIQGKNFEEYFKTLLSQGT